MDWSGTLSSQQDGVMLVWTSHLFWGAMSEKPSFFSLLKTNKTTKTQQNVHCHPDLSPAVALQSHSQAGLEGDS